MKPSRVVFTLKIAQPSEVDIATKGSLEAGSGKPFVKPGDTVVLVNVSARRHNIVENAVILMGFLQFIGRNH